MASSSSNKEEMVSWSGGKRQRDALAQQDDEEPQVRRARSQEDDPAILDDQPQTLEGALSWPCEQPNLEQQLDFALQRLLPNSVLQESPLPQRIMAPKLSDYCAPGGTQRYLPRPEWFRPWLKQRKRPREPEVAAEDDMAHQRAEPQQQAEPNAPYYPNIEAPANGLLPNDAFAFYQAPVRRPPTPPPPSIPAPIEPAGVLEPGVAAEEEESPIEELRLATFGRDCDSALHVAIREGATEAALQLIAVGASVHAVNSKGVTPIILASQKGNLELVEELWKGGASVVQASNTGSTCLIQACHFGHANVVKFLLEKGHAMMNVPNHHRTTPLMRAAQEGHYDICSLLLNQGAQVNCRNNEQMTALMLASQRGHASIVELLVDAGAHVDTTTTQDSTSLMLACKRGHGNVVEVLVRAGCELWIRDSRGRTAKDMAVRKNDQAILKWLHPDVQIDLMQRKSRKERNYTMIQLWTLLQQERAYVPLGETLYSIHNMSSKLLIASGSLSALVRTMMLPAPLLEHIAAFLPLPRLWERRTSMIIKQCTIDPNAAIAASLNLIDEVLDEGGFVQACDEANVTPPSSFSSWREWKEWGCQSKTGIGANSVVAAIERPNVTVATLPGLPRFEPSPTSASPERPRIPFIEMRRGMCYLQLLAHRTPMLARVLSLPPYRMNPSLLQQLITVSDVQSLSRRMGSNGVQFEATVAMEILMLACRVCTWFNIQYGNQTEPSICGYTNGVAEIAI